MSAATASQRWAAGTVAVLLPGAYYLRETQLPPVAALREAGVPIALATDHNPGSSPTLSPLLMMNMACTLFRMTPEEVWRGFTVNAARALGLPPAYGVLALVRADFAVWDADIRVTWSIASAIIHCNNWIQGGQRVAID
jgi:imidazolonepropionase